MKLTVKQIKRIEELEEEINILTGRMTFAAEERKKFYSKKIDKLINELVDVKYGK